MVTSKLRLDRIASSTRNARLGPDVLVGPEITADEGFVLAVRVVTDKPVYNQVEDLTGRMVRLRSGDVVAGVLGSRRALRGYAGEVPHELSQGDVIQILNLGGVLGKCTAINPDLGPPFDAEVLGAVLTFPKTGDRVGRPATIRDDAVPQAATLEPGAPVVAVAGTCMDSGKTVAASEIVSGLTRAGLRVAGVKLTGVSLRRDALSMLDAGAVEASDLQRRGGGLDRRPCGAVDRLRAPQRTRTTVPAAGRRGRVGRRHPRRVRGRGAALRSRLHQSVRGPRVLRTGSGRKLGRGAAAR